MGLHPSESYFLIPEINIRVDHFTDEIYIILGQS